MVLQYIETSINERGYPPTLREIGNYMGIRSTNGVNDHLRALERKGYLVREDMKSRALRPIPLGREGNGGNGKTGQAANDNVVKVPIIGRVAAGQLTEAIEQPEATVNVDRSLLGNSGDVFGLRINGESMIEAGIHDGDYVFVRKQPEAKRGDIVVARVGEEATCKYYYPERDRVRLQPANKEMEPILIDRDDYRSSSILGVVVGVFRQLQ
jgi:repressor LexA